MPEKRFKNANGALKARVVFVGGAPRSGTTLVQRLLDSHPEIAGGPELNALPEIIALYKRMKKNVEEGRTDFYFNISQLETHFFNFIMSFFKMPLSKYDAKIASEKTPTNVLIFEELSEIFPDAFFIFVIRDPKDVLASNKALKKKAISKKQKLSPPLRNCFLSVDQIYKHMYEGFRFCNKNPERSFIIKYEDLVKSPEETSMSLMEFLNLQFDEKVLELNGPGQFFQEKRVKKVNSIYYDEQTIKRQLNADSIGRWEREVNKRTAGFVEHVFKDLVEEYNIGIKNGKSLLVLYYFHKKLIESPKIAAKFYRKFVMGF